MRNTSIFVLALLVMGVLYSGCKEKPVTTPGDLEHPKINMTSPETVPLGSYVNTVNEDSFDVDVRFTDDKGLRDYEITIRFAENLDYLRTANDPWSETWHGALEGTSDAENFRVFVVYNPTAGPYEFRVKVTDLAGKTTETVTYLYVKNSADSLKPRILVSSPDTMTVDTVTIGSNLQIQATANDFGDVVRDVYIRVRDRLTNELMEGSEIRMDTLFQATVVIDTFVNIPAGTVPGDYNLEIYANDPTNNVQVKRTVFYVKPN